MIRKTGTITRLRGVATLVAAMIFAGQQSMADDWGSQHEHYDTYRLSGSSFHLSPGEVDTVELNGWRYVKKIYVQAAGASNIDGTLEVIANGDVKGTIYVPGRDPSYVVTIGEAVRSLQFRHTSGGAIKVYEVKAMMSERRQDIQSVEARYFGRAPDFDDVHPSRPNYFPRGNQSAALARRAIVLVDLLEGYTNYRDYGTYLLPIKKAAGRAYANATGRGNLSRITRRSLIVLVRQIDFAAPYLDDTFERDNAFQLAVELMGLGEEIDHDLD